MTALSDSGVMIVTGVWHRQDDKHMCLEKRLSAAPARQGRVKGSSSVTVGRPGPWGPAQGLLHALQGIITLSAWLRAAVRWADRHRPAPDGLVNRGQENAGCGSLAAPIPTASPPVTDSAPLCLSGLYL